MTPASLPTSVRRAAEPDGSVPATPFGQDSPQLVPAAPGALSGSHTLISIQSLVYIIVVAVFAVTFSLQPFRIPSASMEPTLLVGDFLLVDKVAGVGESSRAGPVRLTPSRSIRRGDIIVFHYPIDPALHLVKRVIGLPGDRLRMRGGRVFINGVLIAEPYAVYSSTREDAFRDNFPHLGSTDPDVDSRWWAQLHQLVDHGELRIPPDHYFVLGDNRNDSEDSRYWGLVPGAAIVGEPLLVYFSLRDPASAPVLAHDLPGPAKGSDPAAHRTLAETLVDLARWDRVFHVVH